MKYAADIVQHKEQEQRATALCAWAVCADSYYTVDALATFEQRGFSAYRLHAKDAINAITTADANVALLPLSTAFLGLVDRESVLGRLDGAVRLPLASTARLQVGTVTAQRVSEGGIKPVMRLDFDAPGDPLKVEAQVVVAAEALRALGPATTAGLQQALVSATAAATDVELVTLLTAGAPSGTATPAALLAAISDGAPRRPVLVAGFDTLLGLSAGTIRDLQALGIGIVPTPAAAGMLIALDCVGMLIGGDELVVQTARHADILMDAGGSPAGTETVNLWQKNMAALRAERWLRLAVRADAVAWATVGP